MTTDYMVRKAQADLRAEQAEKFRQAFEELCSRYASVDLRKQVNMDGSITVTIPAPERVRVSKPQPHVRQGLVGAARIRR